MRVLVVGGTGTVGSEIVRRLIDRKARVRVLTRSPDRNGGQGAEYVAGELEEAESLPPAFEGMESVYLLTPLHPEESRLGLAAVRAAADAGIERLVFQSIHNVEAAPHMPHFKTKIEIVQGIRDSGLPHVLIAPNNFFQNDRWVREAIIDHGVYPHPFGNKGLSRVDVRDIADAAVSALLEPGHEGREYPLVGPDVLTAEETAKIWSRHVGREVRYGGDDLDAWAAQVKGMYPDWLLEDLRIMYRFFQEKGLIASQEDLEATREILGREPRSFDAYAAETAASWKTSSR